MNNDPYVPVTPVRPAPLFLRRVSWGAIFAGLVVGLVTQLVLSLLGVAIGASTIDPLREQNPASGYGTGALIWFGISALISAFVGACIAGRLSGGPRSVDGLIHGVVSWSAATLLTVFLLTTAVGGLMGGAATFLGRLVSGGSQVASQSGGMENIRQQVTAMFPQAQQYLPPTGRAEGSETNLLSQAAQNPELMTVMTRMFSKGGAQQAPQERQEAINLLVRGGMDQQQAANTIDRMDRQYQQTRAQAEQKTREVGAAAAKGTSAAAWGSFALLLLSAALAAWGGWIGTRGLSYIQAEHGTAPAT